MLLTRKAEFSASHVCANPAWSEERNREVYGANANPNGHGHNYVLEVTIEGEPDPVTGMVFDLRELKEILNEEVVEPMDHRFLNRRLLRSTGWSRPRKTSRSRSGTGSHGRIGRDGVTLRNVRLYETGDLFVDYGGAA